MTFLEMQTEVFRRLDESSSSPAYWSLQDVKDALNEGYETMAEATEFHESSVSINRVANQTYYDLATLLTVNPILVPNRLYNPNTNRWATQKTVREFDAAMPRDWEVGTGEAGYWMMRGAWLLGLVFKPKTSSGTYTLYGSMIPTALSTNGDTPTILQEFHLGIVAYAVYDLLCEDHEASSLDWWGRYLEYEGRLRTWVRGRIDIAQHGVIGG